MTEHSCLSRKQCVSRTSTGPAITAKPDTLCTGCIRDIQRCLDELPTYRDALRVFLGSSPKTALQSKVSMTAEPSTPYNVKVADLIDSIDEVVSVAGGYGALVRDLVQRPADKFLDAAFKVVYLTGVQRALDIRRVHSKADAVVGLGKVWERRKAPCPECDLPTLGTWVGSGTIYCTNSECATTLTQSDYEGYCVMKAESEKK
ncbi:Uncharacterised protein [Mycobacteroides abscessus subsp. abscessus]|nr:Uncharacterised protein [Mycobacteroides abscessus subsp. abscessus]SLC89436.1 Uncharacterised protein [Mycobacteroides abscessus subsp. abscessus]